MSIVATVLAIVCQVLNATGQLLLKHGMVAVDAVPRARGRVTLLLAAGFAAVTLWFLLWMGLMQSWSLSAIYPFEGLSPVLIVLGAKVFLGEKLGPGGWAGVGLIAAGVILVAGS